MRQAAKRKAALLMAAGACIALSSCAGLFPRPVEEVQDEAAAEAQAARTKAPEADESAAAGEEFSGSEAQGEAAEAAEEAAGETAAAVPGQPEEKPPASYAEHPTAPGTPDAEATEADLLAAVLEKRTHVAGSIEVLAFIKKLESDRLLLVEIRKQVPEDRTEAEIYLQRLKTLASQSDPVRLVPLGNRVLENSITYFDWLVTEFESSEEELYEYYIGGARGFHFALEEFRSAAMFVVINRLEIAARLIRDLETDLLRLQEEEEY